MMKDLQIRLIVIIAIIVETCCQSKRKAILEEVHFSQRYSCQYGVKHLFTASSEIHCVNRCLKEETCGAMNFITIKVSGQSNCEVFLESRNGEGCSLIAYDIESKAMKLKRLETHDNEGLGAKQQVKLSEFAKVFTDIQVQLTSLPLEPSVMASPSGSSLASLPFGSSVKASASGSSLASLPLGSSVNASHSGSSMASLPLGSTVKASPSGSSLTSLPLGSSVNASPSGSSLASLPLGSSVKASPSGSSLASLPLGSSVKASPSGSSLASLPFGSNVNDSPSGFSLASLPFGSNVNASPSGFSLASLPLGSSVTGASFGSSFATSFIESISSNRMGTSTLSGYNNFATSGTIEATPSFTSKIATTSTIPKTVHVSCKDVLDAAKTNLTNGVYTLESGDHYCVMGSLGACGQGGWTLALTIDGSKHTFKSNSVYWTNEATYNAESGLTNPRTSEAKYPAFNSLSFNSFCIGMNYSGEAKFMLIEKSGSSLRSIFNSGSYIQTFAGRSAWKSMMSASSLQSNCNKEGVNVRDSYGVIFARVGIIANNDLDCATPNSYIGLGTKMNHYNTCPLDLLGVSCGNLALCYPDNGVKSVAARGHILVK